MTGTTTIYPEPEAYNVVPQGPACPPTSISLDNFQLKATYYLYRNGDTLVAQDDGANGSVDFGIQTLPGKYTVRAQFTFTGGFECWKDMKGSVDVYPEPNKYSLLPLGPTMPSGSFIPEWIRSRRQPIYYGSDTYGIRQKITGTGGILQFKSENQPGQYWVVAKTGDSCSTNMYNTITVHPSPTVFHVIPPGLGLCEPAQIGLDGAEINTTYELLHADGTSFVPQEIFNPTVAGAFFFTTPQPAGSFIVKATNIFGCDTVMNGTAIINSLPVVDAGVVIDTICSPPSATIVLNGIASNYSSILWSSPTNSSGSNFTSPNSLSTVYTFTAADLINKKVTLTLTASGMGICSGEEVKDEILIHLLAPIIDAGVDQTVCMNEKVQLNGSVSGGATSGVWTTSGDGTFNDPTSLSAIYTQGSADQASRKRYLNTYHNKFECMPKPQWANKNQYLQAIDFRNCYLRSNHLLRRNSCYA